MIVSLLPLTINIHFALMIRGLSRIIQYQSPIYRCGKHGLIVMRLMLRAICTCNNLVEPRLRTSKEPLNFNTLNLFHVTMILIKRGICRRKQERCNKLDMRDTSGAWRVYKFRGDVVRQNSCRYIIICRVTLCIVLERETNRYRKKLHASLSLQ